MKLRAAHYHQLLSYAEHSAREGWYYAPKAQFEKRHKEIMEFLCDAIKKSEKPAKDK